MLRIEVPKDRIELERQIAALEYQVSVECSEKDREIFEESLNELRAAKMGVRP